MGHNVSVQRRDPNVFYADRQAGDLMGFTFPVTGAKFTATDPYAVRDLEATAREQRLRDWPDPIKRADYLRQDAIELRQHLAERELERGRKRIKLRYAAMVAADTLALPVRARRQRFSARSTIWRG